MLTKVMRLSSAGSWQAGGYPTTSFIRRVWTGEDAKALGLVDVLGGLEDAIQIAAHQAGIEKYNLVEYPVIKSPFEELITELTGSIKTQIMQEELGSFYYTWQQIKNILNNQGLMARIPYDIISN